MFGLIDSGWVHAADAVARSAHAASVARDVPQGQGYFAAALGVAELTAGHILHARRLLTEAQVLGRLVGDVDLQALATGARALTYAMVGEVGPPVVVPAFTAQPKPSARVGTVADNAVRAAAWSSAGGARSVFLEAAAVAAKEAGEYGRAATMAGELALLGEPVKACRIFDASFGALDGDLFPLWPQAAAAEEAHDGEATASTRSPSWPPGVTPTRRSPSTS